MFGEVLGLWCVQSWIDLGRPKTIHLIEYGPGRGIMMSDMLRAAALDPDFKAAVDRLCFVKVDVPAAAILMDRLPNGAADARKDDLLEICPSVAQIVESLSTRFAADPGRALFIDYGPEDTEFGDTLQALKRHEKVGVFSDPGNTDLTARVDFAALSETAKAAGLTTSAAVPQREFLSKLGLEMRAVALIRAKPDAKPVIARQLHRLTDANEMGELFKAICLSSPDLPDPLGLR